MPIPSLEPIREVLGVPATNFHGAEITFTDLSPDGLRLATASTDHTGRLWDARTRQSLTEPLVHSAVVNCIRFSPDGLRVLTSSADRRLRVWDAGTGMPLTDWLETDSPVFAASFSTNGQQVVASNGQVWEVYQSNGLPFTWLPDFAESIAGTRFNAEGLREKAAHRQAAEFCRGVAAKEKDDPRNQQLLKFLGWP